MSNGAAPIDVAMDEDAEEVVVLAVAVVELEDENGVALTDEPFL